VSLRTPSSDGHITATGGMGLQAQHSQRAQRPISDKCGKVRSAFYAITDEYSYIRMYDPPADDNNVHTKVAILTYVHPYAALPRGLFRIVRVT